MAKDAEWNESARNDILACLQTLAEEEQPELAREFDNTFKWLEMWSAFDEYIDVFLGVYYRTEAEIGLMRGLADSLLRLIRAYPNSDDGDLLTKPEWPVVRHLAMELLQLMRANDALAKGN